MRKRVRTTEPVSYWKSLVDVITGLMMVILLVLMFFVLNFLIARDNPEGDDYHRGDYDDDAGYNYNDHDGYDDPSGTPTPTVSPSPTPEPTVDANYGGGGGGGDDGDDRAQYEEEGVEGDGGERCAVYAVMVDVETGQEIPVPDVTFELYSYNGARQTLSTHYPELVAYTQYKTTDGGWFYLPEKIVYGTYYFRQITELQGYDFAVDTVFEVEMAHEWEEPLVVRIPFGASKNNIQVQINDSQTGLGLENVVFDVVATHNIVTTDGTIRYYAGSVVTTIECDENGYGLSNELYLGMYTLVPRELPYGYAAPSVDSRTIDLPRRTAGGEYAPIMIMTSELTSVNLKATDEFNSAPIEGVTYQLSCSDDPNENRTFVTDSAGNIHIDSLRKSSTYTLRETGVPGGYIAGNEEYTFTVDELGLIDNEPTVTYETSFRLIRAELSIIDRVFNNPLLNYNVTILDDNGNVVMTWVSNGASLSLDGIETGVYSVMIEGVNDKTIINIKDTAELQKFEANIMTSKGWMVLITIGIILAVVVAALITVTIIVLKKRHKEQKKLGA